MKTKKTNKSTRMLHAAYAVRGRAAALLAAFVAFDPIGAQVEALELFYEMACGICDELADKPSVDWDWIEAHRPKIPAAKFAKRNRWAAYLANVRRAIARAGECGVDRADSLLEEVNYIADEI